MVKRFIIDENGEVKINKINLDLFNANDVAFDDKDIFSDKNIKQKKVKPLMIFDINGEVDTVVAAEYILSDKYNVGWSFMGI